MLVRVVSWVCLPPSLLRKCMPHLSLAQANTRGSSPVVHENKHETVHADGKSKQNKDSCGQQFSSTSRNAKSKDGVRGKQKCGRRYPIFRHKRPTVRMTLQLLGSPILNCPVPKGAAAPKRLPLHPVDTAEICLGEGDIPCSLLRCGGNWRQHGGTAACCSCSHKMATN